MNLRGFAAVSALVSIICLMSVLRNSSKENIDYQELAYRVSRPPFVVVMLNMAYVLLYAFGKVVQHLIFNELREVEQRRMHDRLVKYILFKFVMVGSILEFAGTLDMLVWLAWFSGLGFLKLFSLLSRDRFEYLTTHKPNTALVIHLRILGLLVVIMLANALGFTASLYIFRSKDITVMFLLMFECITLFLSTVQTVAKYGIHLVDQLKKDEFWELRGMYIFYTEFVTDSLILVATIGHYTYVIYLHGLTCRLAHIVLFLHMRLAFMRLRQKIATWSNYRKMNADLNTRYQSVNEEELVHYNDSCAICLTHLSTSAKKLPCNHIFHTACLRSWLERNHSCPTCRKPLRSEDGTDQQNHPRANHVSDNTVPQPLFRFNPLLRWMPPFRVQVTHWPRQRVRQASTTAPEEWIHAVHENFPHIAPETIAADLCRTRSVDATIDNLLHSHLLSPTVAGQSVPSYENGQQGEVGVD